MRSFFYFLLFCSLLCSTGLKSQTNMIKIFKGVIYVRQDVAEVKGDSVLLHMDVYMTGLQIGRTESLSLMPVLQGKTKSLPLSPIILNGKNKEQMKQRKSKLKDQTEDTDAEDGPYIVLKNQPNITQEVSYTATVPFQPWMNEAGLSLIGVLLNYNDERIKTYRNLLIQDLGIRKIE